MYLLCYIFPVTGCHILIQCSLNMGLVPDAVSSPSRGGASAGSFVFCHGNEVLAGLGVQVWDHRFFYPSAFA